MEQRKSGMATTSFVLGIIAFVLSLTPFLSGGFMALVFVVWILAILAIIFGIIGLAKKQPVAKCVIGLVLSVLAVCMPGIFKDQFAKNVEKSTNRAVEWVNEMESSFDSSDFDWD